MREVEFLPTWYAQLQKRRRSLVLQVWVSVAIAVGLGLWVFLAGRNRCIAEDALGAIKGQWEQANEQVQQLDRMEALSKQWRQQAEVLGRLGEHVKVSQMLAKLGELMPPTVSLLSLELMVEETSSPAVATGKPGGKDALPARDRRLRVKLVGVAPTNMEMATFVIELNKVPFFDGVAPTYARDRRESGHVLREFELTFSVNLNTPIGN